MQFITVVKYTVSNGSDFVSQLTNIKGLGSGHASNILYTSGSDLIWKIWVGLFKRKSDVNHKETENSDLGHFIMVSARYT